jgi:hypothetical protein
MTNYQGGPDSRKQARTLNNIQTLHLPELHIYLIWGVNSSVLPTMC